ncbi:MAG: beta-ketoacyl-[acyl-carrier-protein] synthase II, partial [Gemmatimonadota bacterium]|nr:beta-ketoacyl-[acyl-carrier-protein] synthase II [Gemmatimonadota bacterium]
MSRRRVVVTGLGVVSPLGLNLEDTWAGLLAGRSGAARIKRFDPSDLEVRFGCEVKDFDPTPYIDRKEAKRFDLFLQYAIAAATQAMEDAGLGARVPEPERAG